jgi:cytochrome P450
VKTINDAPLLDMMDPAFRADPGPVLDKLRAESWLARTAMGGCVISRDHVQLLLADRRLGSPVTPFIEIQGVTSGLLHDRMCSTLLAVDGDDHTRVRRSVRKAFLPSAVDRYRPMMREVLERLVAGVSGRTRWDFMAEVAEHYPIQVICRVLGAPVEDHDELTAWIRAIAWALSLELATHRDEAEAGMKQMDGYVADLVARRRAHPGDDLVTELTRAEEGGQRLSGDELQSLLIGLLFAGYDTTRNQLGLAMWTFSHHLDQWALLAAQPELAPQAVEEVMRFRGAVSLAPRLVVEDLEFDGYHLEAGSFLMLSTVSANHDPAAYENPHAFDITVSREPQLTFGGGPHYCLGAGLARAEMQEALPLLARTFSRFELDGEPTWTPPMNISGPATLPIRVWTS